MRRALLIAALLVAGTTYAAPPSLGAAGETCQGKAATVVGPTSGADTIGTEANDVIVAPVSGPTTVRGLGGDDTICLVAGPPGSSIRDGVVDAGPGNDVVLAEDVPRGGALTVFLGAGADSYVGRSGRDTVYAGAAQDDDADPDVLDTRSGGDLISSGQPGTANADSIATGAGVDLVLYAGAAGGHLDDGGGADRLALEARWTGALDVDNTSHSASLDGTPLLTWTAIDSFVIHVGSGGSLSFTGSDAAEYVGVQGTKPYLAAPGAIVMGGGDDRVELNSYRPGSVDGGDGQDQLSDLGRCSQEDVRLAGVTTCASDGLPEASTALAGFERLHATGSRTLSVRGTAGPDVIDAFAQHLRVQSQGGDDRVLGRGFDVRIEGGPGADSLRAQPNPSGSVILGGRGDDVMRGSRFRDRLIGGRGMDTAYGNGGRHDYCLAEVRVRCERP